ncbi:ATP-dependent DNA helicase [Trichonephila clavipes]|nr:ATP-dependent DNA helicase [Trichonephila clavipes]
MHILILLIDKIRPEEINSIIFVEILHPSTDKSLFHIVTTNIIHGPCGNLNHSSPCIGNGKCTKSFPKNFTYDTIINVDRYPIYRRRNADNGGQSFTKNVNYADSDIKNHWVVPYSPLLRSDRAVFRNEHINVNAPSVNNNDEIMLYQIGRYIRSTEAVWRIFGFKIHDRDPAVIHLPVHLENGQRVFFTNEIVIDRAINPSKTTFIKFFELCNRRDAFGDFARKLL